MIYLVGVDHDVQHNGRVNRLPEDRADEIRHEFQLYIESVARKERVQVIAEEGCEEINAYLGATATMPRLAAETLGIEHRYIEPCGETRKGLGIPDGPYNHLPENRKVEIYSIREQYWLELLEDMNSLSILVVCGGLHVHSFSELLSKNGKVSSVIDAGWGKEYMPHNHQFNIDAAKRRGAS